MPHLLELKNEEFVVMEFEFCFGVGDTSRTGFVLGGALGDWETPTPDRRQCMLLTSLALSEFIKG